MAVGEQKAVGSEEESRSLPALSPVGAAPLPGRYSDDRRADGLGHADDRARVGVEELRLVGGGSTRRALEVSNRIPYVFDRDHRSPPRRCCHKDAVVLN